MERTYQQFVDFVKSQPEDKPINHSNMLDGEWVGWSGCAVGEFVGGDIDEAVSFSYSLPEPLREQLEWPEVAERLYPTYGELAKVV